MQYPLVGRDLLDPLRLAHGGYNLAMLLLFFYQGALGLRIRRTRNARAIPPLPAVRRHRRSGPVLAGLGVFGFLFGLALVLIDTGKVMEYPGHFFAGFAIVVVLLTAKSTGAAIRGPEPHVRKRHLFAGITLLCLYALNCLLGLGVLL